MDSSFARPPPQRFLRTEVGEGGRRLSLTWEPDTGILHLICNGRHGNHLILSKEFHSLRAEKVSDALQWIDGVLGRIFDGDLIAAAKRMVAAMMSILPDQKEKQ